MKGGVDVCEAGRLLPPKLSGPVLRNRAGGATSAFLKSNRPEGTRADERNGDEAQVRDRAVLAAHPMASKRPQV
jgi:hypothetical protein